jgi:hypothetical protein
MKKLQIRRGYGGEYDKLEVYPVVFDSPEVGLTGTELVFRVYDSGRDACIGLKPKQAQRVYDYLGKWLDGR